MHDDCHGQRRARWDWDAFAGSFWGRGGPRGGRHGRGRMGRMFDQGDLKYVILQLLDEKPRHGYDVIKELEARSKGAYSPSPGTVYPTLTLLEEMGYAKATETGGKKVYEITPEGKAYLAENMGTVDAIFERITAAVEPFFSPAMGEVRDAMRHLARSSLGTAMKHADNTEVLAKIAEILKTAATGIDGITV